MTDIKDLNTISKGNFILIFNKAKTLQIQELPLNNQKKFYYEFKNELSKDLILFTIKDYNNNLIMNNCKNEFIPQFTFNENETISIGKQHKYNNKNNLEKEMIAWNAYLE